MSEIHINNLFPTPVMRVENFLTQEQCANLISLIKTQAEQSNSVDDRLSHTGVIHPATNQTYADVCTQTEPYLRDFGFLLFGENLSWTVKEMWMNRLKTGGHQTMHTHANSFVSGILYLTDPHPSTHTIFHKPMGGKDFIFSNSHAESAITPYNAERWVASDVNQGDMVLFPSYMLHAVPENQGGERITIAFNALPESIRSWDYAVRFSG